MEALHKVKLEGEFPEGFELGFNEIAPMLGFIEHDNGDLIKVQRGNELAVIKNGKHTTLVWKAPVHIYRALSLLCGVYSELDAEIHETPFFETGMMFDVSRNAVLKPEALRLFIRRMALMGINLGMMYTEDTYEVPNHPYIGYMRGRYSIDELKQLDDYAHCFGIELCPCIQTLGHLNRVLHWPAMARYADNGEVLLADSDDTYSLLKDMIAAASAPYRSKRIHIGMDEAHGVGLGAHLREYGFETPHAIIHRHLLRVKEITDLLGLDAMMWSDMYFRPDSPTNSYYDSGEISQEAIESVVPGIKLFYWDYYHNEEHEYTEMLKKHKKLAEDIYFAGAVWTFTGPAPEYDKTIKSSVAALSACKQAGVHLALATAWGDNGAEANLLTALPGMQLYAEFAYKGEYNEKWLEKRFKICCNGSLKQFFSLTKFNCVNKMKSGWLRPVNAAKFLLYQDPLVQLFSKDTQGLEMENHYLKLESEFAGYAENGGEYSELMEFYRMLAVVLAGKCHWHENISSAVMANDVTKAVELAESLNKVKGDVEALRHLWRRLWNKTNKPYGFEVIDGRLGAICARLETAGFRVKAWAMGDLTENLDELRETVLPYTQRDGGTLFGSYAVSEIVSACKIDL